MVIPRAVYSVNQTYSGAENQASLTIRATELNVIESSQRSDTRHVCGIEIGDALVIVSILGVFANAAHISSSEPIHVPLTWAFINAFCAGFSVLGGLRRNSCMIAPYICTLVIDLCTAGMFLVVTIVTVLDSAYGLFNYQLAGTKVYRSAADETNARADADAAWLVAKMSAVATVNIVFLYVCFVARETFIREKCNKECCKSRSSHRSASYRTSSVTESHNALYETISSICDRVPVKFRAVTGIAPPPSYRSGPATDTDMSVVVHSQQRARSIRMPSVTESHNELYQHTWHGAMGASPHVSLPHRSISIFPETCPELITRSLAARLSSTPVTVSIGESHNDHYENE